MLRLSEARYELYMASLFSELKRRNVFRMGIACIVVAWLIVQLLDVMLPTFGAPDWVQLVLILIIGLGLPISLLFAWAYDADVLIVLAIFLNYRFFGAADFPKLQAILDDQRIVRDTPLRIPFACKQPDERSFEWGR